MKGKRQGMKGQPVQAEPAKDGRPARYVAAYLDDVRHLIKPEMYRKG